ncbi:pyridoxal-dependent decarboxylase, exosortase A system-associated [Zeimonas arvi]|uniref:Pyridoxal-dependent decarboxylase, exosortase A system-associated n=1 Tax=Zeimonas arvi TaxID=2498847 RepID=A0A5C8NXE4_9BURK|nr:pyridoxal-dependent decarboxylase, exosortase A system-associated [Zeimonas arvi]TXL65958.1 pyridoxal-dependent decarboxylase, exosortase A system-associated [Zeimonas arvi]
MTEVRFAQHAPTDSFRVVAGEIAPGGIPITRLAERVGRTPFYVYDRAALTARAQALRAALPAALHLHYAIKANPMPAVVQHLAGLTDGLDVASAQEMMVALDTGMAPEHISFAGPGKTAAEIRRAVAAGITMTAESEAQLDLALAAGSAMGIEPRIALRVNPAFELKAAGMKMGGGPKPFGIDEAKLPALLDRMKAEGIALTGLHIFSGSQNLKPEAIVDAQQKSYELARGLLAQWGRPVRWLNLGGGFGVPYFPGEQPLDVGPIAGNLHDLCERAEADIGAPLVIELGRYLVAHAGLYVCRVLERKESCGQVFLVTDGGLHHHLAASGNFGQVLRKNFPVAVANRIGEPANEVQSVVGPLCTPLDILADKMQLAHAEPGDLIAVFQSGAYGLTASPAAFLSHPAAAEVLV